MLDEISDLVSGCMLSDVLLCKLIDCGVNGFLNLVGRFLGKPVRNLTGVLGGLVVLQGGIN